MSIAYPHQKLNNVSFVKYTSVSFKKEKSQRYQINDPLNRRKISIHATSMVSIAEHFKARFFFKYHELFIPVPCSNPSPPLLFVSSVSVVLFVLKHFPCQTFFLKKKIKIKQ